MKLFGWFGMMTPEQRARKEITDLDREIYDAEKSLHSARATLAYLSQRRDFLITQYGLSEMPRPPDSLSAPEPRQSAGKSVERSTSRPAPRDMLHNPGCDPTTIQLCRTGCD